MDRASGAHSDAADLVRLADEQQVIDVVTASVQNLWEAVWSAPQKLVQVV